MITALLIAWLAFNAGLLAGAWWVSEGSDA